MGSTTVLSTSTVLVIVHTVQVRVRTGNCITGILSTYSNSFIHVDQWELRNYVLNMRAEKRCFLG